MGPNIELLSHPDEGGDSQGKSSLSGGSVHRLCTKNDRSCNKKACCAQSSNELSLVTKWCPAGKFVTLISYF